MTAMDDGRHSQEIAATSPLPGPEHRIEIGLIPWETRSLADLSDKSVGPAEYDLWMRTPEVGPELAPGLVAYATDLNVIGTVLRQVDGSEHSGSDTEFTSATTSHTLWFHRPFRSDDWLLLRRHRTVLAHGRAYGRGDRAHRRRHPGHLVRTESPAAFPSVTGRYRILRAETRCNPTLDHLRDSFGPSLRLLADGIGLPSTR